MGPPFISYPRSNNIAISVYRHDTPLIDRFQPSSAAGSTLDLCAGTWLLGSTITVDKELTLVGAEAGKTVLDGQGAVRVQLRDLTITRGNAESGSPGSGNTGGGTRNEGILTLTGVAIAGNTAASLGGGIFTAGTMTLGAGSQITGNTATDFGGGIHTNGIVTLQAGSQVMGNTAGGGGGGISNLEGTVTLQDGSRVEGNTAEKGGGIYNDEGGTVTLQDRSRVTGNTATNDGGGIYNLDTVTVGPQALVCDNTQPSGGLQCVNELIITGDCPNPTSGSCPP